MQPRISICIPVWEQHGFGLQYLKDLITSIQKQSFTDYEIVISDHSENGDIYSFLLYDVYADNRDLIIRHEYYKEKRGNGVANLNNALRMAKGEIIKVMFQDDFMVHDDCLKYFDEVFKEDVEWVVCGCCHTRDGIHFNRYFTPSWNDKLLDGVNTISSPSVLAFKNENIEFFDEDLTMLMDVEYYYRLHKKYGLPKIIEGPLITNRQHPNQISSRYDGNLNLEIQHAKNKHDCN